MHRAIIKSVFFVMMVSSLAYGNVWVSWQAPSGFEYMGSSLIAEGSGLSTLAQLIWSSDNIIDDVDVTDINFVGGNDVWLADLIITEDGVGGGFDGYAYFGSQVFNDGGALGNPNGGYIYARIFQDDVVDVGDWYYNGVIIAATDQPSDGSGGTQPYNLNRDELGAGLGDAIDGTYGAQVQPVPEPGTMALFALGLATLGASRRRRKVQA